MSADILDGPFEGLAPLILASGSPRRIGMLADLGLAVESVPAFEPEPVPDEGEPPQAYAQRAAGAKAREVAASRPGAAVLAADTVVSIDGLILGKPENRRHAARMLRQLSGRTHLVATGVCLLEPGGDEHRFCVASEVCFADLDEESIWSYVGTGESMDKAGAYAIQGQGAFLVSRISGSVSSVIGLPMREVAALLRRRGIIRPRRGGEGADQQG